MSSKVIESSAALSYGNGTREVLSPVAGQARAAGVLQGARRRLGTYPYQWIWPGPNSKLARPFGVEPIQNAVTAYTVLTYRVPQGLRFSLRGIVFECDNPSWSQGSNQLTWSLNVVGLGGRPVEYLANVTTSLGSRTIPFPLDGRLEFESLTDLEMVATVSNDINGDGGNLYGILLGHTYPNSDAGDD